MTTYEKENTQKVVLITAEFRKSVIPADAIARAIAFAIEQPEDVDVNEIIVRPIGQSG